MENFSILLHINTLDIISHKYKKISPDITLVHYGILQHSKYYSGTLEHTVTH